MTTTAPARADAMSTRLLLLLSLACAVGVGNLYFPQAITPLIAAGLDVPPGAAAPVVTAIQLGYTAGIFLLVPLGDRLPGRPFLVALLAVAGAGLLLAAAAPALPVLVAASALVGVATIAAQVIAPMAAGLVDGGRRGTVLGTLLSGSMAGMLLARAFGGTLGEWLGWRAPYLAAAVVVLLLAGVLAFVLPVTVPAARGGRPSLLDPLRLLRAEPELRRSCLYQAAAFGGFSAVWTCVALLLTGPVYGLDTRAVGLLALVGAATIACTPLAGRLVDRRGADAVTLVCLLGLLAAAAILAAGARGGTVGLVALTAGTLVLDVAMQSGTVANQSRVLALRADARGRLNTAYMTCSYLGGTAGSWAGLRLYAHLGWTGVCALVAVAAAVALTRHLAALRAGERLGGEADARRRKG
ncbi:MFS transporter [Actinomadura flavalba]|uniref:MFS transporter n=1 Tax=Actinomadura flavalba TaxID=1120938 RepID=UPI00036B0FDB|nr:MFS transporter [Actinomadura flavalba]